MSDHPKESCGLCGVFGVEEAAAVTYYGLHALQHRGQESAGIVASDGKSVRSKKGMGLVTDVFSDTPFDTLPGTTAIGHVRYSTAGGSKPQNIQPLVVDYAQGLLAVAHNGNLVNARSIRSRLEQQGSIFQTGTDSEVIVHLMARPEHLNGEKSTLKNCLTRIKGAFSFLFMTKDTMTAVCDPHKLRPLAIGRLGGGYIVASETCVFDVLDAEYVRDIEPGEIVVFSKQGMTSSYYSPAAENNPAHCIFEMIYFARPDSNLFKENVHLFRSCLGQKLSQEQPADADIVISVPDSGNSAAIGFSEGSGIPFQRGFIRNHYVGRTFIQPDQDQRIKAVKMKLNVIKEQVRGKRVVVVDDSIIRGVTSKSRLMWLRKAGASEIHMRISCPPCRHPCYYGIDFPSSQELIASNSSIEEIRDMIGADSLGYTSLDGMLSCVENPGHWCHACFSGEYPVEIIDNMQDKYAMDQSCHRQRQ